LFALQLTLVRSIKKIARRKPAGAIVEIGSSMKVVGSIFGGDID
jgi:hypothetical protein